MVPYFVVFLISILICGAGERMLRHSRTRASLLLSLSVLFPVVLAGAREYTVGTYITTYGNYIFNAAGSTGSLIGFLRGRREIEPMYKALAWSVSRFTNNPHWFYFVTALLICACTMGGLYYYRRWCSITLGWACFLFLFYGDTLNTMRQCLALAVVFCTFPLFLEKKYLPFALLQGVAVLFHVTGVLALALPLLYLVLEKIPPQWVQFFFIIGCMGVILLYSPLLGIILRWGLLPAKFSRYIANGVAFALNPTMLRLPFLVPVLVYYDRFCGFGQDGFAQDNLLADLQEDTVDPDAPRIRIVTGMFVVIMLLLEICTVQLRSVRPALYRISYYFGYYRFLAYPRLVRILRRDNRLIVVLLLFAYLCVLWYYQNVVQGNNQIYPYIYAPGWFRWNIPVMPEG